MRHAPRGIGRGRRGYTLVELLVVVLIVVIVGAATIRVAVLDQGGRQVSEAARLLQATIVGARDAAFRANAPRGIRLLPDPAYLGTNSGALASNRMIAIETAPDYNSGRVTITSGDLSNISTNNGQISVTESDSTTLLSSGSVYKIPNESTSWYWNVRVGDKIRFDDSGRYYTIAGPNQYGAYVKSGSNYIPYNVERYVNYGPPGYVFNPTASGAPYQILNDPNPLNGKAFNTTNPTHFPEILHLVNGQDDDGDGWIDESFDGIDNDGDGIIDPGYNGIDENGDGVIDDPAELSWPLTTAGADGGEYEAEQFVGNQFISANIAGFKDQAYTIVRQPVVSEGAREMMLPQGVVIDLTTWNAPSALSAAGTKQGSLPERSRVPINPYSLVVDIMIGPNGQVVTSGPGQSSASLAGGMGNFPTSNMPFYHFWIAEREDIYDPLWSTTPINAAVPNTYVPLANTNYPTSNYLLPMPQSTPGYAPPPGGNNGPYLKGDRRLVTLFVKTGQVVTNPIEDFDASNTSFPYYRPQSGTREAK